MSIQEYIEAAAKGGASVIYKMIRFTAPQARYYGVQRYDLTTALHIRTKKHVRNAHSITNAQKKNIAKSDSNQNSVGAKQGNGKQMLIEKRRNHQMSQPKK